MIPTALSLDSEKARELHFAQQHKSTSQQISALPDFCCNVTRRLVESVCGLNKLLGVYDSVVSSATAVFARVRDELAEIPCLL